MRIFSPLSFWTNSDSNLSTSEKNDNDNIGFRHNLAPSWILQKALPLVPPKMLIEPHWHIYIVQVPLNVGCESTVTTHITWHSGHLQHLKIANDIKHLTERCLLPGGRAVDPPPLESSNSCWKACSSGTPISRRLLKSLSRSQIWWTKFPVTMTTKHGTHIFVNYLHTYTHTHIHTYIYIIQWESVGILLRPLGNAPYICSLSSAPLPGVQVAQW